MIVNLINGLPTLRAYDKIDFYKNLFIKDVEKAANATFTFIVSLRWLGIRLDGVMVLFNIAIAIIALSFK